VKGDPQSQAWAKEGGQTRVKNERILKDNILGFKRLGEYLENEGAEKAIEELESLNGKDFIASLSSLMEYKMPKLARTDNTNKNINIDTNKAKQMTDEEIEEALKNAQ